MSPHERGEVFDRRRHISREDLRHVMIHSQDGSPFGVDIAAETTISQNGQVISDHSRLQGVFLNIFFLCIAHKPTATNIFHTAEHGKKVAHSKLLNGIIP